MNKLDFLNDIETLFYKEISLICIDDQIIAGTLSNYTSELDNEPDGESIMIETRHGPVEIYTSEIKEVFLI